MSHVDSDEAFGVALRSSSFGKVEVDAVPKLGDDGVDVGFLLDERACCDGVTTFD